MVKWFNIVPFSKSLTNLEPIIRLIDTYMDTNMDTLLLHSGRAIKFFTVRKSTQPATHTWTGTLFTLGQWEKLSFTIFGNKYFQNGS